MASKKSNKKATKKVVKVATKVAKKNPALFVVIVILVICLGVGGFFAYKYVIEPRMNNNEPTSSQRSTYVGDSAAMDINFLELGNKYTGDSTFIKAGDVDILIDAGSRQNSATTIANFIDNYCTDGVLEYVIATHAHQDHIAGFVGSNSDQGILKRYKIDTLIDFSLTNATSSIYNNYVSLRDEKVASGSEL